MPSGAINTLTRRDVQIDWTFDSGETSVYNDECLVSWRANSGSGWSLIDTLTGSTSPSSSVRRFAKTYGEEEELPLGEFKFYVQVFRDGTAFGQIT